MSYEARFRTALDANVTAPTFATPAVVTYHQRARLAEASERLAGALEILGRVARQSSALDAYLGLDAKTLELLRSPSFIADVQVFTRFDVLGDLNGAFWFIECNASDPSGIGWVDGMVTAHKTAGSTRAFDDIAASHIRTMASLASFDRGCLVLATDRDSPVRTDLLCLASRYRAQGIDARVVDTRELRVEGDAVFVDDTPVAALHRDLLDEYTIAPFWPAVAPLVDVLRRGVLPVVNPFAASLIDTKAIFEVLTSDIAERYFDRETVQFFASAVPWTRRLTAQNVETTVRNREQMVLKPARGYGGEGVVVGHAVDASTWSDSVMTAIKDGGYVVQRAVTPSKIRGLDVVYGAWVHRGSFAGTLARVGQGAVLNVHRGGALLPVAYVSEVAETPDAGRTIEEMCDG